MENAANIIHISRLKNIILNWEKTSMAHLKKWWTGLKGMLLASRSIATMEKRVWRILLKWHNRDNDLKSRIRLLIINLYWLKNGIKLNTRADRDRGGRARCSAGYCSGPTGRLEWRSIGGTVCMFNSTSSRHYLGRIRDIRLNYSFLLDKR